MSMHGRSGRSWRRVVLPGALALLAVLASCSGVGPGGEEPGGGGAEDAASILRALGVVAVDNPPELCTTSTQGAKVTIVDPGAWHPLKKAYAIFNPKAEATFFGQASAAHPAYFNSVFGLTVDYSEHNFITDDQSWEKTADKAACAADLDGDGLDEFAVFYIVSGSCYLRVYDYGTGKYSSALKVSAIAPSDEITAYEAYHFAMNEFGTAPKFQYLHLEAADVDGNGKDELLLADYDTVYVVETDNAAGDLDVLERRTFNAAVTSLAAGDTDGDREDEFVVCVDGKGFGYYDSSLVEPLSNPEMVTFSSMGVLEACIGDFDGDSVDELAITNNIFSLTGSSTAINVYETSVGSGSLSPKQSITSLPCLSSAYRCDPRAVDLDGDGGKDLYSGGYVITTPLEAAHTTYSLSSFISDSLEQVGVGDMDGDGREDLVLLERFSSSGALYSKSLAVGLTTLGNLATKYTYCSSSAISYDDTSVWLTYVQGNCNFGPKRVLAVGNADKDSARVRYAGHRLKFTDPAVVAVLASPPYWSAVAAADEAYAGSYVNWETSYGTFTSRSTSNGLTLGASIGCTVKYEQEGGVFGIKLAQFESELTTKAYLNQEISWSSAISKSVSYTAVGGEDKVIFLCVPKDAYSYEILESPDSANVGHILTLEIPRDYKMYSVTRSYFNANNGKVSDIDSTVLSHGYGNPASYPGKSAMEALMAKYGGYKSAGALPVAQGNDNQASGVQALEISVESGKDVTTEVGVEVEASIGGGGGGASVLADLGFSAGYIGSISAGAGTSFGGTVGYLPTRFYGNSAYSYSSGLFAYPFSDQRDGRQFWIVDYWVE